MYKSGSRILPALLILIAIVIAIVALVAVIRAFLGGDTPEKPVDDRSTQTLLNTDADHSVRMTVRGPIVANEEFRSYRIEVGPTSRRLVTLNGYDAVPADDEQFGNTSEAYAEFVNALSLASYTKEADLSDEEDDTRGVCANGRLYTFEIMVAQSTEKELWTTSCRDAKGSFRGEAAHIRDLFLDQIPDSRTLLRDIDLS
jgi:hypothetical protein